MARRSATQRLFTPVLFRTSAANNVYKVQSYVPVAGALLARRRDLGFSGPGGYYTDSAYNLGLEPRLRDIPHTSSSLKLEILIEGVGVQSLNDESWAMDNLDISLSNPNLPQVARMTQFKVAYPLGPTPYFTGLVHGVTPMAVATLQASTDLGKGDIWQNLSSATVNANGSVSFTNIPDTSASGSMRNFYRVMVVPPVSP